jgi:hypothetical protein
MGSINSFNDYPQFTETPQRGNEIVAQGNVAHSENKESPLSLPSQSNVT